MILGIIETIIIGTIFYEYIDPFLFLIFYCFNYGLGAFIDPDSDLSQISASEWRVLRETKKINFIFGFFGACHVSYWFIYSYLCGKHRSWISHSWIFSTIFRVIYFNIPLIVFLILFYNFAMIYWGWFFRVPSDIIWALKLHIWFIPYILSQYFSLQISDGTHIVLDTEIAKGWLYTPVTHNKDDNY